MISVCASLSGAGLVKGDSSDLYKGFESRIGDNVAGLTDEGAEPKVGSRDRVCLGRN